MHQHFFIHSQLVRNPLFLHRRCGAKSEDNLSTWQLVNYPQKLWIKFWVVDSVQLTVDSEGVADATIEI